MSRRPYALWRYLIDSRMVTASNTDCNRLRYYAGGGVQIMVDLPMHPSERCVNCNKALDNTARLCNMEYISIDDKSNPEIRYSKRDNCPAKACSIDCMTMHTFNAHEMSKITMRGRMFH